MLETPAFSRNDRRVMESIRFFPLCRSTCRSFSPGKGLRVYHGLREAGRPISGRQLLHSWSARREGYAPSGNPFARRDQSCSSGGTPMPSFGAVEAGGTKFVCAVGTGPEDLPARTEYPTTSPEETLGRVVEFFGERAKRDSLAAVGIASFGPLDLNPTSPRFGFITTTPKAGWRDVDLAGPIRRTLNLPVAFDTDVNAAALGEHRW